MNQTLKTYICNGIVGSLLSIVALSGCQQKMTSTDYFNYFNSYQKESYVEAKKNGIIYKLQYRPMEYQALNALKGTGNINKKEVQHQIDSFGDNQMYCLRIGLEETNKDVMKYNLLDESEYYHRIELLNSAFSQLTWGLSGEDTIYTGFHHFERAYKLRPFIQVMFSMSDQQDRNPDKIVFDDFIFNQGEAIVFENMNQYNNRLPKLGL